MPGSQDSSFHHCTHGCDQQCHGNVSTWILRDLAFIGKDAVGGDQLPLQMARGFGNEYDNSIEGDVCTL